MSGTEVHTPAVRPKTSPRSKLSIALILASLGFIAMAIVVQITNQYELTSGGTVSAALVLAAPIGLAGLGGLWSERAGIVNIGLEGMLILGTFGSAWGAYVTDNAWVGLCTGILGGALGGLLHAVATVSFGVDHIVSGVAITILAGGLVRFMAAEVFEGKSGGSSTQSPELHKFPELSVPGVKGPLEDLEREHIFLLSDLAGVLRGLTTDLSAVTVIAILLVVGTFYVLWRTPFGLRVRSVGENPFAAESLGVHTYTMRYIAVTMSGAFAGLGGVFLSMVATSAYQEGQVAGRGYIGLAAMIFGNWRPGGLAAGAGLFGYADALQLRGSSEAVHALLLLLALVLFALFVWTLVRRLGIGGQLLGPVDQPENKRGWVGPLVTLATGLLLLFWYASTSEVPEAFTKITPHVTTILVLALFSQRLRPPAWDGKPYRHGDGT